ncbi:MAG: SGNH/GDSL hydrolase family protein [Myxococcales bacterium]|nr:SGNH/GDSL hydrolase family protein [Myxococcales bacterium]
MTQSFVALLLLLALAPCGTSEGPLVASPTVAPAGGETAAPGQGARAALAAETPPADEPAPPPSPPDEPLRLAEPSVHSPLGPRELEALRAIVERATRREDVFAKMGGSSIESRAFLHCFARGDDVDLGARTDLTATLEHFRGGNAGGGDPFRRESLAAKVGWSLRQGLTGRPPRVVEEARVTDARYALAFFGGNDVQGRDPRTFGERMERVIELLGARGVVPILGAVMPRGDNPAMDEVARRYNRTSRALARAWGLPYVDFYAAVAGLPGRGLAGDGVHPNVLLVGGRSRACDLTEEGLERGQNQRNLRTLEALDRLRRALSSGEPLDESPAAPYGAGTPASPLRLAELPFGERVPAATLGAELDGYSCEGAPAAPGRERVYRVRVEAPTRLWMSAYAGSAAPRLFLLGATPDPSTCVHHGVGFERELEPGVHHVVVELPPGAPDDVTLTVLADGPAD